jgi:hypothetical protein
MPWSTSPPTYRNIRFSASGGCRVVVKATLLIFFLVTGIPEGFQFKQRHDLEVRAVTAAHTLHNIYVMTPNQSLRIVYANSWTGNVCMEYVVDDARQQSLIRYAVFEKNSKFVNYDLGQEDIEDRCSMGGTTDLTNVAEKELKDESEDGETVPQYGTPH